MLIPGLVGFHLLVRAGATVGAPGGGTKAVGLGGLAVLGVLVNPALALEYQRERAPNVPESLRAQWSGLRASLPGSYEPLAWYALRPLAARERFQAGSGRRRV